MLAVVSAVAVVGGAVGVLAFLLSLMIERIQVASKLLNANSAATKAKMGNQNGKNGHLQQQLIANDS